MTQIRTQKTSSHTSVTSIFSSSSIFDFQVHYITFVHNFTNFCIFLKLLLSSKKITIFRSSIYQYLLDISIGPGTLSCTYKYSANGKYFTIALFTHCRSYFSLCIAKVLSPRVSACSLCASKTLLLLPVLADCLCENDIGIASLHLGEEHRDHWSERRRSASDRTTKKETYTHLRQQCSSRRRSKGRWACRPSSRVC